ncbi:MAG: cytochrome c3 family protein [Gemmatimonadota bacterium]
MTMPAARIARRAAGAIAAATIAGVAAVFALQDDGFDHWQHRKLFPTCTSCHVGAVTQGRPILPAARSCASCHDGKIRKRVRWAPREGPPHSNLRFTHVDHAEDNARRTGTDSVIACATCHAREGAPWMEVRKAETGPCFACHGLETAHLSAPDSACAACHVPLAEAVTLTRAEIGNFPEPDNHKQADFLERHGKLAGGTKGRPAASKRAGGGVAASCATCHARDFCVTCHVNAPETPAIQALAPDVRSTVLNRKEIGAPASHATYGFAWNHRAQARQSLRACQTCHTRESCLACHIDQPSLVSAMYEAGPGRSAGARVVRRRPDNHGADFTDTHGRMASSKSSTCAACHARTSCLACHRPHAAASSGTSGYHAPGFLQRHPTAAYSRETSCSDCHNSNQFCRTCHEQAGLTARRQLVGGYHDAKQRFALGHGQAARQNLESCVACHAERDCLTCHSALGGRRFNPHGPGFDPDRLRKKNPQQCTVCHGTAIPGGS